MSRSILVCVAGLSLLASAVVPPAKSSEGRAPVRKLLFPADPRDVPAALRPHVGRLLAADQKPVEPGTAKYTGVFLRIVSRRHVLEDGRLKEGAWAGARPFVFLTVPEAAYGRSLLQVFSAVGYDPEDVLAEEAGVEKVALVFAYPDDIRMADARAGGATAGWDRRVYPTTWENVFGLIDRLAADRGRVAIRPEGDASAPTRLQLRSEKELAFLAGFPDEGKRRVKEVEYATLREVGGADWAYRQLLERTLGASEHFRGDGKTKLTLAGKRKSREGFAEYLGPNVELRGLRSLAVIGLGALRVADD